MSEATTFNPETFEAELAEAHLHGDSAKIAQLSAQLDNILKTGQSPAEVPPAPAASSGEPSPAVTPNPPVIPAEGQADLESGEVKEPSTPQQKKKKSFSVPFRGRVVEVDDEDTYLGFGSHGALKRNTLLEREKRRYLEEEFNRVREELAGTRAKLDAAEKARVAPAPAAAPLSVPEDVSLDAPAEPELPEDILDWTDEHKKAHKKYLSDTAVFMSKITKALKAPKPEAAPAVDEDKIKLQTELETLRKEREEEKKREALRHNQEAVWQDAKAFQDQHPEFQTPEPLNSLHEKVLAFMDKVAEANGFVKPLESAPQKEMVDYNNQRAEVTRAYLDGDAQVLSSAEGIKPPDGYRQYFDIADLFDARSRAVQEGTFTPKTPLHYVWLSRADRSGQLDEATASLEAEATKKGAQSALNSIADTQASYARNLPPQAAQMPEAGATSQEEIALLNEASSAEGYAAIQKDPEKLKKLVEIMSRYAK